MAVALLLFVVVVVDRCQVALRRPPSSWVLSPSSSSADGSNLGVPSQDDEAGPASSSPESSPPLHPSFVIGLLLMEDGVCC